MSLLLFFNSLSGAVSTPTISTIGTTAIGLDSATLQGQITDTGGASVTRRGFQYNTVDYPDKEVYEDGTFSTGYFTLDISGLLGGKTYYFRAFATNSEGTTYGSWFSFDTSTPTYSILINGIDRKADVLQETITIEDAINDKTNTLSLALIDMSGNGVPEEDDEIIITLDDGTIIFGGYITTVDITKKGKIIIVINAVDYVRLMDSNLVHKTYEGMTDKEIIEAIVATYCSGLGITTTNVLEGVTIDQISFNYLQPSQCLRRICDITGRNWFIDYEKDIHYFPLSTTTTPFNITSSSANYTNLKVKKDSTQIKNRVYVRGGTKLSDFTTYSVKGDGVARQFPLPDKPHDISLTVGGVAKTVGIKNVDSTGYDWYVNFQEKYVEQDVSGTLLSTATTLEVTYKYDIPILIAQENAPSILEHGVKEFAIFDKSITTTEAARERAAAELTDYANHIIEGSFETHTPGFRSGQYMTIVLSEYGIDDTYIVQSVTANSMGGGKYVYNIDVASSKTMGIIRFLIELLEANKNLIELDDNEVIDELFTINDSLLSDSLVDNLTIDSAGPYSTWCPDSLTSSPSTRMVWDLFQWG